MRANWRVIVETGFGAEYRIAKNKTFAEVKTMCDNFNKSGKMYAHFYKIK